VGRIIFDPKETVEASYRMSVDAPKAAYSKSRLRHLADS
jgi:hypothetical protein